MIRRLLRLFRRRRTRPVATIDNIRFANGSMWHFADDDEPIRSMENVSEYYELDRIPTPTKGLTTDPTYATLAGMIHLQVIHI